MPIIHPNSAYPHISSSRNHLIHALSGRISLNTNYSGATATECNHYGPYGLAMYTPDIYIILGAGEDSVIGTLRGPG